MKELFTFEGFPMVVIIALIALAYFSFFSVMFAG